MHRISPWFCVALLLLSVAAQASGFQRRSPTRDGIVITGHLAAGRVDRYDVFLAAGEILIAALDEEERGEFHDTLLAVFAPGTEAPALVNDDAGPGYLSRLLYEAPERGVYTVAVTGFGDEDFDGTGHSQALRYQLLVGTVRERSVATEEDDAANDEPSGAQWMRLRNPKRKFGFAEVVAGRLEPGDVDRFRVKLGRARKLYAAVFDGMAGEFNDSVVVAVANRSGRGAESDDEGPGFLSNLRLSPKRRDYSVELTLSGFDPDPTDERGHSEAFDYWLLVGTSRR